MADPRFFDRQGPFSLAALADRAGADLAETASGDWLVHDVAPLNRAGPQDISFLDNRKYVDAFGATQAGACVVHPDLAHRAPDGVALLVSTTPYRAFALIAQAFYEVHPPAKPGRSPTARIDESARIADSAEIGPGAVIGPNAKIGGETRIGANAVIGRGVKIGRKCTIGPHVTLSHCLVGDRVAIYPGARIGQDGFGFAMDANGHVRIPQTGRVVIEDDVEIGANATIDRGAGPDTVIGRGAMIDNLVQIAHNVTVGPRSIIVAQAGVAGSSSLGSFAVMAAQSGVAGHLKIGDGAQVLAQAGVMRDVPPGEKVVGAPARPAREFWRLQSLLTRLLKRKD